MNNPLKEVSNDMLIEMLEKLAIVNKDSVPHVALIHPFIQLERGICAELARRSAIKRAKNAVDAYDCLGMTVPVSELIEIMRELIADEL